MISPIIRHILLLPVLLCGLLSFGQDFPKDFERYNVKNGLSSNTVYAVLRDSYGFLWVGTGDGLNRFDGHNYKVYRYDANIENGLNANHITALCEDVKGRIWIGTNGGGLSYYDRTQDRIFFYEKTPKNEWLSWAITALTTDVYGNIWVGSYGGLHVINVKDIDKPLDSRYNKVSGSFLKRVTSTVFRDGQGRMWAAVDQDVYVFSVDLKAVHAYPLDRYGGDGEPFEITSIIEDNERRIWIGSLRGLYYMDHGGKEFRPLTSKGSNGLSSRRIYSLLKDEKGGLWVGTDSGLDVLNTQTFMLRHFKTDPRNARSLSHKSIRTIYMDSDGIYWVGTFLGGLNKYDTNLNQFNLKVVENKQESGSEMNAITTFLPYDGNLLVGTDGGGLYRYQRDTDKLDFLPIPGFKDLTILDLIDGEKAGEIWVGTYKKGVYRVDLKANTTYHYAAGNLPSQLNNKDVFCMERDIFGNVWVGTNGGGINIIQSKDGTVQKYMRSDNPMPTKLEPSGNFIRSIVRDLDGRMWVGTYGAGLFMYDPVTKNTTYFDKYASGLPNNYVLCVYVDKKGNIWVGTNGNGIGVLKKGAKGFEQLNLNDGLINDVVQSVVEDDAGRFWFGTNKGLSCYDPTHKTFKNYTYSSGLQEGAFMMGAGLKMMDGEIFFGGQEGLNHFYPKMLEANANAARPVLTALKIDNKAVLPTKDGPINQSILTAEEINLAYKQNFSISFEALNMTAPMDNQYAYRLEGFDKEWIKVSKERTAYYTNLDPGSYVFQVRASNNDGVWDEEIRSIKVYVAPPFWRTSYAYIGYAIIVMAILYVIRDRGIRKLKRDFSIEQERRDSEKLHQLDQLKIRFLTNLSHEFRTPISLIMGPVDALSIREKDKEAINQLSLIKRNTRRLLNLVNQLLDFRRMEQNELRQNNTNGDLVGFVHEVWQSFQDMASQHDINYRFLTCEADIFVSFDQDKVERILFNLLSNAFKFTSKGGSISVHIIETEMQDEGSKRRVQIAVKDNGIGIPKEDQKRIFESFYQHDPKGYVYNQGSGIGLSIVESFVKMYGGTISVVSEVNFGSTFTCDLFLDTADAPTAPVEKEVITEEEPAQVVPASDIVRATLLLVEDDKDFADFLSGRLHADYNVIHASDGKEGWQKALFHHPDLIISDVQMPVMNGMELAQKLALDKRTKHIPVILLTASKVENGLVCGLESGAVDYITKPFDLHVLIAKVNSLLSLHEAFKEVYSKQVSVVSPQIEVFSEKERFLQSVLEHVHENLDNPQLSVETLSTFLAISRTSLYNRLLEFTGMTPVDFIRSIRLERAVLLLEKSHKTISEIAYETGFSNPNYFSKVFKAKYKVTPSEYMQRRVKEQLG